jgi:hypothetical protein
MGRAVELDAQAVAAAVRLPASGRSAQPPRRAFVAMPNVAKVARHALAEVYFLTAAKVVFYNCATNDLMEEPMSPRLSIASGLAVVALSAGAAFAQGAGVCDREFDQTRDFINQQHAKWADGINKGGFPDAVKNAYLVIVNYSRDAAINGAAGKQNECTANYAKPQEIMDTAVLIFSGGLSSLLPGKTAYVDVSEIMNGYPLGGPDAVIPKLREQILGGDRGTIANVIRDPWKCLSFQRKC